MAGHFYYFEVMDNIINFCTILKKSHACMSNVKRECINIRKKKGKIDDKKCVFLDFK